MDIQIIIGSAIAKSEGFDWGLLSEDRQAEYRQVATNVIVALAANKFHIQPMDKK